MSYITVAVRYGMPRTSSSIAKHWIDTPARWISSYNRNCIAILRYCFERVQIQEYWVSRSVVEHRRRSMFTRYSDIPGSPSYKSVTVLCTLIFTVSDRKREGKTFCTERSHFKYETVVTFRLPANYSPPVISGVRTATLLTSSFHS